MLDKIYSHIKNRVVRDLAWALLSPPLIEQLEEDSSYLLQQEYIDDKDALFSWLLTIDQSPEGLINYVQQRSQVRIGIYFEQLLGFYFSHYPRFKLLHQNLQVQGSLRTLGEFDFIILDKHSGLYFHIESAVKFYLGYFQPTLLVENIEYYNWHDWVGPNKKDSLSLKMHSMLKKQLKLNKTPEACKLLDDKNIPSENLQTRLLLRGRFFCHQEKSVIPKFACPDACNHDWKTINNFSQDQALTKYYTILPRIHWLSPMMGKDFLTDNLLMEKSVLLKKIQEEAQQGIKTWMIASIDNTQEAIESERFFIVNDS